MQPAEQIKQASVCNRERAASGRTKSPTAKGIGAAAAVAFVVVNGVLTLLEDCTKVFRAAASAADVLLAASWPAFGFETRVSTAGLNVHLFALE